MKKEETIVYKYYDSDTIYINITNRCSNACEFCIRNGREGVRGTHSLWLEHEPEASEVIECLKSNADFARAEECVFCGFGEPLERPEVVSEVGAFLKAQGKHTRVNTNGQGNLIAGKNIVPLLVGAIDTVSISLNASTPEKYQRICHCKYGEAGFAAMLDFAKLCSAAGLEVIFSVVDTIGKEEIEACRKVAEACRVTYRVREFE